MKKGEQVCYDPLCQLHNPKGMELEVYFVNDGETPVQKDLDRLKEWFKTHPPEEGGRYMITPAAICQLV
jgi:hypothetical protein